MLGKRILTGILGISLLVIVIWFDKPLPWFTVFAAVWGMVAVYEFYRMAGTIKVIPLTTIGIIGTLLIIISPHCSYAYTLPLLLASVIILSLILLIFQRQKEGAFQNWAWTIGGVLYVGWLLSFLVLLRLDGGRNWLFFAMFVTFASDTVAFFIGSTMGKHHLAPVVSPKKTWEGAIGGIFGAVIIALLFTIPSPLQLPLSVTQAILLGLLVSVFGQFGDLVESVLKRNAGVKESGNLMPGHGGLLDRMDSVVFAGVVVYCFFLFTYG
ncbi:phosphatidate cytidylyltransferase [Chloroflexota bacterium]